MKNCYRHITVFQIYEYKKYKLQKYWNDLFLGYLCFIAFVSSFPCARTMPGYRCSSMCYWNMLIIIQLLCKNLFALCAGNFPHRILVTGFFMSISVPRLLCRVGQLYTRVNIDKDSLPVLLCKHASSFQLQMGSFFDNPAFSRRHTIPMFTSMFYQTQLTEISCYIVTFITHKIVVWMHCRNVKLHIIHVTFVWPGNIWVVFAWYLGHLESPITPVVCLFLMWIFHIFILSNLKL